MSSARGLSPRFPVGDYYLMRSQATPQQRITAEVSRCGRLKFVAGCSAVFDGTDCDSELILVLGGRHAEYVLAGLDGGVEGYWPRVWATRGFLHCYEPSADAALAAGLSHESWRVREMALKVVARYAIDALFEEVVPLRTDDVARVRIAAERALRHLRMA